MVTSGMLSLGGARFCAGLSGLVLAVRLSEDFGAEIGELGGEMDGFPDDWEDEDDVGLLDKYVCATCKNEFWASYYDGMPNLNIPICCPYCRADLDIMVDL